MYFWIGLPLHKKEPDDNVLPDDFHDFVKSAGPSAATDPCREIFQKYASAETEKRQKGALSLFPPGSPQGGIERIVELRIRQWIMQKQQEARNKMSPGSPG